jgi:hypothetical protein
MQNEQNQTQPIQPQVPVQPAPEPVQVPIGPKRSLPKWPLIIAGVILLATLLTGGFVLSKNVKPSLKPTASRTIVATPTPDPTATWKTFKYNLYTIQAPNDWTRGYNDLPDNAQVANYDTSKNFDLDSARTKGKEVLKIEIFDTGRTIDIQTYRKTINQETIPPVQLTITDTTVDNQPAFIAHDRLSYYTYVKSPYTNTIFQIAFYFDFLKDTQLRDKILSTFKFTTQTSPEVTINSFYKSYFACRNRAPQLTKDNCPFSGYKILSPDLITKLNIPGFADPVLCAQNPPNTITVAPAIINGNTAKTTVHTTYSSSGDNPINVTLVKQNGSWIITDIICTKP